MDRVEGPIMTGESSGGELRALTEIASDAQILAGLLEELERRGVTVA
jgi:hypothetical protein